MPSMPSLQSRSARTLSRFSPAARLAAVALAVLSPLTSLAQVNQVKQVDKYYVVVTANKLPMKCADLEVAYPVAELPSGQVLVVDGETSSSLRVAYTPSMTAYVRADEISLAPDGASGRLVRESRLKAPHYGRGFVQSWSSILQTPLPVGTTLKIIEPAKADDGSIAGYRVPAPAAARGYIARNGVRDATQSEREAYEKNPGQHQPAARPGTDSTPATPVPANASSNPSTPASQTPTSPAGSPRVNDLTEPQVPGGGGAAPASPTTPQNTGPAGVPDSSTTTPTNQITPTTPPVTVDQGTRNPASDAPPAAAPATPRDKLTDLESSFAAVRREKSTEAEVAPLMRAYQNLLDEMESTPENQRRRLQVQQRVEFLRLQQDWQTRLRKLESDAAALDSSANAVAQTIADIERTRVYNLVGQLVPSLVYDGKSLPLMYQVRTVGGPFSRTLGYIRPDPELKLEAKTGLVVGVVGEAAVDPTLQLNIVTPIRIDVLKAATDAVRAAPAGRPAPAPRAPQEPAPASAGQEETRPTGDMLPPLPAGSEDGQ